MANTIQEKFDSIKHMIPEKMHALFEALIDNVSETPAMADLEELASLAVLMGAVCESPTVAISMAIDREKTIMSTISPFLFAAYNIGRARERDPLGGSFE